MLTTSLVYSRGTQSIKMFNKFDMIFDDMDDFQVIGNKDPKVLVPSKQSIE